MRALAFCMTLLLVAPAALADRYGIDEAQSSGSADMGLLEMLGVIGVFIVGYVAVLWIAEQIFGQKKD